MVFSMKWKEQRCFCFAIAKAKTASRGREKFTSVNLFVTTLTAWYFFHCVCGSRNDVALPREEKQYINTVSRVESA